MTPTERAKLVNVYVEWGLDEDEVHREIAAQIDAAVADERDRCLGIVQRRRLHRHGDCGRPSGLCDLCAVEAEIDPSVVPPPEPLPDVTLAERQAVSAALLAEIRNGRGVEFEAGDPVYVGPDGNAATAPAVVWDCPKCHGYTWTGSLPGGLSIECPHCETLLEPKPQPPLDGTLTYTVEEDRRDA